MKWNVFLLLIILSACNSDTVKIPSKVFSKEEMVSILIDIHLADVLATNEQILEVKDLNDVKKAYFISVLEKNNITIEAFEKSYQFYENHPEIFYEVYEEVMIELTKREAELNGVNELEQTEAEKEKIEKRGIKGFHEGSYDENDNYQENPNNDENPNQDE